MPTPVIREFRGAYTPSSKAQDLGMGRLLEKEGMYCHLLSFVLPSDHLEDPKHLFLEILKAFILLFRFKVAHVVNSIPVDSA